MLVHGAWHGGWCWRDVAELLRGAGHRVFTPTLTGLGERAHLMSRAITLDTWARDVLGVIEAEEIGDITLVGHSFAGGPISAVAERARPRIRSLIYLDSMIVQPGQSPLDAIGPEAAAARRKTAEETSGGLSLPPPPAASFGVPPGPRADWVNRRLTPHPFSTYESKLELSGPIGAGLPRTYIHCTSPPYASLAPSREWVKTQSGWRWLEIPTGHDAMVAAPDLLAGVLARVAGA